MDGSVISEHEGCTERIAALEQHVSELEKSLENARKERDAAIADSATLVDALGDIATTLENKALRVASVSRSTVDAQCTVIERAHRLASEARTSTHPGAALLEVVSELRQYQHRDEPDVLATLRRLLVERSRIAHMVNAEQHRKAVEAAAPPCCGGSDEHPPEHTQDCPVIVRARNEGLEEAVLLFVTLEQDSEDEGDTEAALDARHWIMRIRALKEPEEGGQS